MATDGLARGQGAPTKYGGLHGYSQRARIVVMRVWPELLWERIRVYRVGKTWIRFSIFVHTVLVDFLACMAL